MKQLTADQVAAKQAKAVQFSRDVKGDDDLADEFEDMDLDEYAEHKGIEIVNSGDRKMANGNGQTKQDLLDQIADLQEENADLQDQLDSINDILNPPDEDDDDDDQD